ncbi:MAG TPA: DEAD/DEAH box helicase [Gammaproteobacteria bacterium]
MSFNELGLSAELLRAVNEQGYSVPTPIQSQAIPVILEGRDIMAAAQTGTGKTAGFTLPLLQRLNRPSTGSNRPIRALVLTPTRELAAQVEESVRTYGRYLSLQSAAIFGGVNINPQFKALRRGVDILVATPGRLMDHVQQRTLDLSKIEILVLDEADRMLDMGFIPQIRKILALLPRVRQNLLFSATFSAEIKKLADGILQKPALVEVSRQHVSAELVTQIAHPVEQGRKRELLSHLIGANNWQQVLVFIRTKHSADRLAKQLQADGLKTVAIHGNKSQGARTRALADFKSGAVRVLVATDIAARGLDIDQLPHVVNYDLPNVPEDYVHRIGRTGRAGNAGQAISLVSAEEKRLLKDIERLIRRDIPREVITGYPVSSGRPAETAQFDEGRARQPRRDENRKPAGRGANPSHRHTQQREDGRRSNSFSRNPQRRDDNGRSHSAPRDSQSRTDNRRSHSAPRDTHSRSSRPAAQPQPRVNAGERKPGRGFKKQGSHRAKSHSGQRAVPALLSS